MIYSSGVKEARIAYELIVAEEYNMTTESIQPPTESIKV